MTGMNQSKCCQPRSRSQPLEILNDEVMLDYVIFADENFSLPIQIKSTLYYFIHCIFNSLSMKATQCLVLVSEYRIQLSMDMNEWMVHIKNKRYLLIWPSPLFFSFSGNCFFRTVVLTVFDKNGFSINVVSISLKIILITIII